jgi:hypothetical protein
MRREIDSSSPTKIDVPNPIGVLLVRGNFPLTPLRKPCLLDRNSNRDAGPRSSSPSESGRRPRSSGERGGTPVRPLAALRFQMRVRRLGSVLRAILTNSLTNGLTVAPTRNSRCSFERRPMVGKISLQAGPPVRRIQNWTSSLIKDRNPWASWLRAPFSKRIIEGRRTTRGRRSPRNTRQVRRRVQTENFQRQRPTTNARQRTVACGGDQVREDFQKAYSGRPNE